MFQRIATKIERHQFLGRSEFTALAEMLAKIRQALTRIDCSALRAVKLALKTELALRAQFCYDAAGFGYFKFQN